VSKVQKWVGVLIAGVFLGPWERVEGAAPKVAPSVEEIAKAAMARVNAIQSIRVEYEERWKVLRSIPDKTEFWQPEKKLGLLSRIRG
jgi:hypothetical protein